jgi:hypothetical protein
MSEPTTTYWIQQENDPGKWVDFERVDSEPAYAISSAIALGLKNHEIYRVVDRTEGQPDRVIWPDGVTA